MIYRRYFKYRTGKVPIILSCPHGGFKKPRRIRDKGMGFKNADTNTYEIAVQIIERLKFKKIKIYYILTKIHRSKIDLNRPAKSPSAFNHAAKSSKTALKIHHFYHKKIQKYAKKCVSKYIRCLFLDLHGFSKPNKKYPDIIIGNVFGKTLNFGQESNNNPDSIQFWGFSELIRELSDSFTYDDGLCLSNFNYAYSGGYITYQFYQKEKINAIQIELAKYIRLNKELTDIFVNSLVNSISNSINKVFCC